MDVLLCGRVRGHGVVVQEGVVVVGSQIQVLGQRVLRQLRHQLHHTPTQEKRGEEGERGSLPNIEPWYGIQGLSGGA